MSELDFKEHVCSDSHEHDLFSPFTASECAQAHVSSFAQYKAMYTRSVDKETGDEFWAEMAKSLTWQVPFSKVKMGSFELGNVAWFLDGKLNVSVNCIDRHLEKRGNQVALICEGDEIGSTKWTYNQLHEAVCKCANMLKFYGVKRGDSVCIYMPMIAEAAIAMLACTRIGAPHSVVFAGFSSESLSGRLVDGKCKFIVTADEGRRAGKSIPLKLIVDEAIKGLPIQHVFVFPRTGANVPMKETIDIPWVEAMAAQRPYCPVELMDSEDVLFYLYTSGSTGKPKGIAHTTAGYLLMASLTHKYVFDYREGDVYACMADVGWVTGHSYILYGPLANGATSLMFESTPMYPNAERYWECVERHRISLFYTAPTAIRALMKFGEEPVKKHDISSLRVLGSVGEPINPEAWRWYYNVVGRGKCAIVDTYWQTETGAHIITPLPYAIPQKAGSATLPFFGIVPVLLDMMTGKEIEGNDVSGVLCIKQSWPSLCRTIYGDHDRYLATYMKPYPGYYFTGDGAMRDKDGYYWITGRVDDVMNVSGHRIGSAEVESALVQHQSIAEAAVIGIPHDIKGTSMFAYVIPKQGVSSSAQLVNELKLEVRKHIGAIAVPDDILVTNALPKTRSGKIMRRILRKIASNEMDTIGDISTLADPSVVADIISAVATMRESKSSK